MSRSYSRCGSALDFANGSRYEVLKITARGRFYWQQSIGSEPMDGKEEHDSTVDSAD
jgi:hypothetical protein